jgi:hypothetical protein
MDSDHTVTVAAWRYNPADGDWQLWLQLPDLNRARCRPPKKAPGAAHELGMTS